MLSTVGSPAPLHYGMEPFPGYRLDSCLGRGSFGEVWKASTPTGRPVALKFLPCEAESAISREIRSLQKVRPLRHPNLIRIDQVWCHLGYVVIAMELADGSLHDVLDVQQEQGTPALEGPLVCHYLAQAAAALDFLNARQHMVNGRLVAIQHCDVKPSNLLVFGDRVKVADFGLASWLASSAKNRLPAGTLEYCAPEVLRGRLADQTDQYSLAVTYCALRGGRLPFALVPLALQPVCARPSADLTMLPEAERPIVGRALDPLPSLRWATCGELMSRLARVVR